MVICPLIGFPFDLCGIHLSSKSQLPGFVSCDLGLIPPKKVGAAWPLEFLKIELVVAFGFYTHSDLCARFFLSCSKRLSTLVPVPPRGAHLTISPAFIVRRFGAD